MFGVKFVCKEIGEKRFFDVIVDECYLTTIEVEWLNNNSKLKISLLTAKESDELSKKLKTVFHYCMVGGDWNSLIRNYTVFFKFLYEKYKCPIIAFYNKCKLQLEEVDFNGKKVYFNGKTHEYFPKACVGKIEAWLDDIIFSFSPSIKLETITPSKANRIMINDIEFYADGVMGAYYTTAKISGRESHYGDFYAAVILTVLFRNNDVVRNSIKKLVEKCKSAEVTIVTERKNFIVISQFDVSYIYFTYKLKDKDIFFC